MNKIVDVEFAEKISKRLRKENKIVVVSGGCFDILHIGHIKFLEKAKKEGDFLFILLESDKTVKKIKGDKRPINSQEDRALILSSISFVDYVVKLPQMKTNNDYDNLIIKINPNVIATTKNDPQVVHNKRQAEKINAKVSFVTNRIKNKSTSRLAEIIYKNFDR